MTIPGIDYFSGDGSPNLVGETFAFIKATEDLGYQDPPYTEQRGRIGAAGAVFGTYHFCWPIHDPLAQADYFLAYAQPVRGDVLYADFEGYDDERNWAGMSWGQRDSWRLAFIDRVRARTAGLRCRVGTYANLSTWQQLPSRDPGDFLIVADYSALAPVTTPAWLFWQFGTGGVDFDLGGFPNEAALRAWAINAVPPPPLPAVVIQEDDMITSSNMAGRAGLSWSAGSKSRVQVGLNGANIVFELNVQLVLTSGPVYVPEPWKIVNGTGVYTIPAQYKAACRGVILTWGPASASAPYDVYAE